MTALNRPLSPLPAVARSADAGTDALRWLSGAAIRGFDVLVLWTERARHRAELASMDRRQLQDVGLEPGLLTREIEKPFWRG